MVERAVTSQHLDAEALFRAHAPFVARFLFRLGVRPETIDDVLQEVFIVVHSDGGYRGGKASPTTYLASIALRLAANHRRKERTRARVKADLTLAQGEERAQSHGTPVQQLEANEVMLALQSALEALDPDLSVVLILCELEEQPFSAVAAALGIPLGTVYWRLHRAKKELARIAERMQRDQRAPERTHAPTKGVLHGR